jgi:hypothetical protein
VAAPKILPRPGGRGCAKNPADRKFTLSSRFAFHYFFAIHFLKKALWCWATLINDAAQEHCQDLVGTHSGENEFVRS